MSFAKVSLGRGLMSVLATILICGAPCSAGQPGGDSSAQAGGAAAGLPSSPGEPRIVRLGNRETTLPQEPLPVVEAQRAYLIIGGFGDEVHGIMQHLARRLRSIQTSPVAYYHWHAGRPDQPQEGLRRIARDVEAFRRKNPRAGIILIGHSLGAGSALRLATQLTPEQGPLYLITLDPIDRSCRPKRPASLTWWGNAYITHSQSGYDILLAAGGRWNSCRAADINLRFDGRRQDEQGQPYIHDRAGAMLFSRTLGPSLYDRLLSEITP